jgi:hypothetical protein
MQTAAKTQFQNGVAWQDAILPRRHDIIIGGDLSDANRVLRCSAASMCRAASIIVRRTVM